MNNPHSQAGSLWKFFFAVDLLQNATPHIQLTMTFRTGNSSFILEQPKVKTEQPEHILIQNLVRLFFFC
jgi:hypothetical protein